MASMIIRIFRALASTVALLGWRSDSRAELRDQGNAALIAAEQQKLVDAHFQSEALYWKEIYQQCDLYAIVHQQRRAMVLAFVDELPLSPESRILEIGCGAGSTAVALAQRGHRVHAIDKVEAMVDLTRQEAVNAGVADRVTVGRGDVYRLPFRDNAFSLVLAIGLMPYLNLPCEALQEMARVVEPGGYLLVSCDNKEDIKYLFKSIPPLGFVTAVVKALLAWTGLPRRGVTRFRWHAYTMKEFAQLLSCVGLEKVKGMTLGFGPFTFFGYRLLPDSVGVKLHRRLQSLADRGFPIVRSAGVQYLMAANKIVVN